MRGVPIVVADSPFDVGGMVCGFGIGAGGSRWMFRSNSLLERRTDTLSLLDRGTDALAAAVAAM